MKIGAIIQARTSSTRLPQKVLKPLPFNSKTNVLQQVIRRVSKSELIDEIIIATTTHDEDEKIVEVAKKENIKFYKGSLENVLERYYNAALENSLDVVVRITSDCPCADANIIDEIIKKGVNKDGLYDIPSNASPEVRKELENMNEQLRKAMEDAKKDNDKAIDDALKNSNTNTNTNTNTNVTQAPKEEQKPNLDYSDAEITGEYISQEEYEKWLQEANMLLDDTLEKGTTRSR